MQKRIYWNDGWKFKETYENQMRETAYQDDAWEDVRLPHTCKETPFHYFDESSYQMVCCYRKHFFALEEWKDQTVIVTFEGIAHEAQVFLNGERIGEHHCGYTAFSIDISKKLRIGAENVLTVRVDSRENLNIPPFGYVIDYMTYGGIYREAYVDLKNETYLADIFLHSEIPEGQKPDAKLISEIEIKNSGKTDEKKEFLIRQSIRERGTENYRQIGESRVASDRKLFFPVPDVKLWDLENPVLYEVKTELLQNGNVLDENITLFGFRTAVFLQDGFYLNGKKVKLRGLNRHQSYPYVGYAMPESMQKRDADILKNELGVNAVRTSHYPQSRHFVERCDELGLLVFTEIPGWQHIGGHNWKDARLRDAAGDDLAKPQSPQHHPVGRAHQRERGRRCLLHPHQSNCPSAGPQPRHLRCAVSGKKPSAGGCLRLQRFFPQRRNARRKAQKGRDPGYGQGAAHLGVQRSHVPHQSL